LILGSMADVPKRFANNCDNRRVVHGRVSWQSR
jgi:hypothetical protein